MTLEEVKLKFTLLIREINEENSKECYKKFRQAILAYRNTGAQGKPLYQFLCDFAQKEQHGLKAELILDICDEISGFCPLFRQIMFPDFDKFSGKWLDEGN